MFALDMTFDEDLGPLLVSSGDIDGNLVDDLVTINEFSAFRGAGSNELSLRVPVVCPADFDGDGLVNITDLLQLIAAWELTDP